MVNWDLDLERNTIRIFFEGGINIMVNDKGTPTF